VPMGNIVKSMTFPEEKSIPAWVLSLYPSAVIYISYNPLSRIREYEPFALLMPEPLMDESDVLTIRTTAPETGLFVLSRIVPFNATGTAALS